mmetsp:Transcript_14073/g.38445  ORF Transcript_14073/g.38445 Transcript_14073/m.38445 type:complete len:200 (-) Transcript_14073:517-1116(-)
MRLGRRLGQSPQDRHVHLQEPAGHRHWFRRRRAEEVARGAPAREGREAEEEGRRGGHRHRRRQLQGRGRGEGEEGEEGEGEGRDQGKGGEGRRLRRRRKRLRCRSRALLWRRSCKGHRQRPHGICQVEGRRSLCQLDVRGSPGPAGHKGVRQQSAHVRCCLGIVPRRISHWQGRDGALAVPETVYPQWQHELRGLHLGL